MAMTKAMESDALITMHCQLFRSGGAVCSRSLAWSVVTTASAPFLHGAGEGSAGFSPRKVLCTKFAERRISTGPSVPQYMSPPPVAMTLKDGCSSN